LLASDGAGGYVGQQMDMHLKGGTVSVQPNFGTVGGGVKADDARLDVRVWYAPSSGKKTDPIAVFLRFGAGDGALNQELTEVAFVWDTKQAKRMKAIGDLASFVEMSTTSADAMDAATAMIAAYATHGTALTAATPGRMAFHAQAGKVLSTVLGMAFDGKHLAATPSTSLTARVPSVVPPKLAVPHEAVHDLAASMDALAEAATGLSDVETNELAASVLEEMMPALAHHQQATGDLLSQLLGAQAASYLGADETNQRIRALWQKASTTETPVCASLASNFFTWA
jgi:hypothetical protein